MLRELGADEVIVAICAIRGMPAIPGNVGAATGATADLDLVRRATHAWMPIGDKVVIIGGELVGVELAEFLMERGRQVTVVDVP
ncbi:hypothetical protein JI59_22010 (plasmid) [Novosphingobium pentaromativorans US6-1]|nr:hypothetical protein JI59_22010 [Novosphingobium pentaromativorans US6-1]